ncbi:MAG: HAD-IA family hydrolase [Hyphomonadaceae bacterium]|nr:HAD-IA family hydrolase [Hyphomonadaceae bacterium]
MTLKLAIWDMDGTIVDSREVISTAMARAFEAVGLIPPSYDETRQIVGLGLEEACRRLAPERTSEETLAHLVEAYKEAFVLRRTEPDFKEPLYDGALETLERLANDNWLIAMATGKSRRGIDAVFAMHPLAQFFDTIHCADDGPGKPHPAMCLEAMKKMGAAPDESLMIGDAIFDIQMGRAAGVHTIGVSWGFGQRHELEASGAHELVDTYTELDLALDRFAKKNQ